MDPVSGEMLAKSDNYTEFCREFTQSGESVVECLITTALHKLSDVYKDLCIISCISMGQRMIKRVNMRYSIPRLNTGMAFRQTPSSKALAMLRWPLAMCIVAEHWFTYGGVVPTLGFDPETARLPIYSALTGFVKAFLSENGVASFFFISGFLFFVGSEFTMEKYKDKLRKRVRSLLVPYIIWNVLTVAFLAAHYLPVFKSVFPRMYQEGFNLTLGEFFYGMFFTTSPHNPNLWFIRELMIFCVLTPVLFKLLRNRPFITLTVMFLSAIAVLPSGSLYFQQFTWGMLFFLIGSFLAINNCDLIQFASDNLQAALVLFPICGVSCWLTADTHVYLSAIFKILSLMPVIVLALWIAGWLVKRNKVANTFLTSATFFVFVFHPLIISHFIMFLARVINPQTDLSITCVYFMGYFLLLLICLAAYELLRVSMPSVAAILTGRRNY